jgi:Mce-associated membrane protein
VAAGRPGGHPVTHADENVDASPRSHAGVNIALYVLTLLLACACVVGAVKVVGTHDDQQVALVDQERYGDVLSAATTEAEAFINIRYDDAQSSIDKVAAGATGDFRKQYDTSTKGVLEVLRQSRSVMDGKVIWAGVVDVDKDSATVIAATAGTVANTKTNNKPVVRNFRLQLDLVYVDGDWLTSDLQFVG